MGLLALLLGLGAIGRYCGLLELQLVTRSYFLVQFKVPTSRLPCFINFAYTWRLGERRVVGDPAFAPSIALPIGHWSKEGRTNVLTR